MIFNQDEINLRTDTACKVLHSMLCNLQYMRNNVHMLSVCIALKDRLRNKDNFVSYEVNWDVDMIYGTMVYMFGNYGVAPRSGWLEYIIPRALDEVIDQEIKDIKGLIKFTEET